jgi:hypothetical protein
MAAEMRPHKLGAVFGSAWSCSRVEALRELHPSGAAGQLAEYLAAVRVRAPDDGVWAFGQRSSATIR